MTAIARILMMIVCYCRNYVWGHLNAENTGTPLYAASAVFHGKTFSHAPSLHSNLFSCTLLTLDFLVALQHALSDRPFGVQAE